MQPIANVADMREMARRKLPRPIFDWVDGGSFDERTLRANTDDFSKLSFRQRALVDVSQRNPACTLMGRPSSLPIVVSPTGLGGILRPRGGETLSARAAAAEKIPFCLAMLSLYPLEEVVAAVGPVWLQIAMLKRRELIKDLVLRAVRLGCPVLIMTCTMPVPSRLTRSVHNRLYETIPPRISLHNLRVYGPYLEFLWQTATGRPMQLGNFVGAFKSRAQELIEVLGDFDASATWEALEWLRGIWPGKLIVKGIVNAEDARSAVERGADGVLVSNHGGIQLDGAPSTIATLSEVVEAVGSRVEVFLDGGVRSGQDVLKAVALGASGCLLGRVPLYGLAAQGEAGVRRVIAAIREEIDITMALTGTTSIASVRSSILYPPDRPAGVGAQHQRGEL
jgi:L-lactate dehydrogenase (cytochrome)